MTIEDIKRINKEKGKFFFSGDAMSFFDSKVYPCVYEVKIKDIKYLFITSEKFDRNSPRLYTIRIFNLNTGCIDDFSEFQEYASLQAARKAAKKAGDSVC